MRMRMRIADAVSSVGGGSPSSAPSSHPRRNSKSALKGFVHHRFVRCAHHRQDGITITITITISSLGILAIPCRNQNLDLTSE
ncbi:GD14370 [Drosophila simulans]|uniref:GD14370 n=1 Tax=Drosophila simulans TaxID=7240 RepID=B4QR87_DROSI|nr:GD14370 [Drosophila simulans]